MINEQVQSTRIIRRGDWLPLYLIEDRELQLACPGTHSEAIKKPGNRALFKFRTAEAIRGRGRRSAC